MMRIILSVAIMTGLFISSVICSEREFEHLSRDERFKLFDETMESFWEELIGYSQSFPASIGKTLRPNVKVRGASFQVEITPRKVLRGDMAWQYIQRANRFNDPPEGNHEYLLIQINFKVLEAPRDTQYRLSESAFTVVSGGGVDYRRPSVSGLNPRLSGRLYKGGEYTGWAAYQVPRNDKKPLLTFGRDSSGRGGLWWKLYNGEEDDLKDSVLDQQDEVCDVIHRWQEERDRSIRRRR